MPSILHCPYFSRIILFHFPFHPFSITVFIYRPFLLLSFYFLNHGTSPFVSLFLYPSFFSSYFVPQSFYPFSSSVTFALPFTESPLHPCLISSVNSPHSLSNSSFLLSLFSNPLPSYHLFFCLLISLTFLFIFFPAFCLSPPPCLSFSFSLLLHRLQTTYLSILSSIFFLVP